MINISHRLKAIADLIEDHTKVVDVGCDHGLLSIYLYQTKKDISVIATDINEKALNNAINNIKANHLEDKIITLISNGLENVSEQDFDTVLLAGMGSLTMIGILNRSKTKLKNTKTIIVQSNTNLELLRLSITRLGFHITEEKILQEKNIYYTIIKFVKGYQKYRKKELIYGPILLKEKPLLFIEKLTKERNNYLLIRQKLKKTNIYLRIKLTLKIHSLNQIINN